MSEFYAVARGRVPGVYTDWDSCKEQVNKFPNQKYKKFSTIEEANKFIEDNKAPSPDPESVRDRAPKPDAMCVFGDSSNVEISVCATVPFLRREKEVAGPSCASKDVLETRKSNSPASIPNMKWVNPSPDSYSKNKQQKGLQFDDVSEDCRLSSEMQHENDKGITDFLKMCKSYMAKIPSLEAQQEAQMKILNFIKSYW